MRTILLIAMLAGACGCTGVYSRRPVGDKPKNLEAELKEWNGSWVLNGSAIRVQVADPANGRLNVGWIEDDKNGLKYKSTEISLLTADKWTFANMQDANAKKDALFIWGRIQRNKRVALVWLPETAKFKRLIQQGILPGVAPTNNDPAIIEQLSADTLKLITSEQEGVLFDWETPLVFFKISD